MTDAEMELWGGIGNVEVCQNGTAVFVFDKQGNASGGLTPVDARRFAAELPEWVGDSARPVVRALVKSAAEHVEGIPPREVEIETGMFRKGLLRRRVFYARTKGPDDGGPIVDQ